MCCMVVWCALATAILVASTHAFTPCVVRRTNPQGGGLAYPSVEGVAVGSSGVARRPTNHQIQHMQEGLWARRRSGATARLSPAETGVPDVADRPDIVAAPQHADNEGYGGSSPSSKKLTERGGLLLLATVPLVWGTYGPSVKLLYQMGESPPGLLFNFACYAVSVMTFAAVASFSRVKGQRPGEYLCCHSNDLLFLSCADVSHGCWQAFELERGEVPTSWCNSPRCLTNNRVRAPLVYSLYSGRVVEAGSISCSGATTNVEARQLM